MTDTTVWLTLILLLQIWSLTNFPAQTPNRAKNHSFNLSKKNFAIRDALAEDGGLPNNAFRTKELFALYCADQPLSGHRRHNIGYCANEFLNKVFRWTQKFLLSHESGNLYPRRRGRTSSLLSRSYWNPW